MQLTRKPWFLPAFALVLGVACLAAFWIGGNPGDGVAALGVMTAAALFFGLGGRSETIRGWRGDGRDERFERMDVAATAIAGHVVIGAIVVMCLWEWAHGRDGSPYTQLGGVAGVSYVLALVWLRIRS